MDAVSCSNCLSLSTQCLQLKDEIKSLTQKLDRLLNAVFWEKHDSSCQTQLTCKSVQTQTDDSQFIQDVTQIDNPISLNHLDTTMSNLSGLSNSQENLLLNIFIEASDIQNNSLPINVSQHDVVPFVMLPYILIPNKPFSHFLFNSLDESTVFSHQLNKRSVCYYGEVGYSYTNVTHYPRPMPSSDNYLHKILAHLKTVLPDFRYNSILLTKYQNGADSLSYHSDNESEILPKSDIVTISFGETRVAKFRASHVSAEYPEHSLTLHHGDIFIMSRNSQNIFQHSIVANDSENPRISLTLRLLSPNRTGHQKSSSTELSNSAPALPVFEVPVNESDVSDNVNKSDIPITPNESAAQFTRIHQASDNCTVFIGDSMFRCLDATKMTSQSQKAIVMSYPGATASTILSRLVADPKFKTIDVTKVKKVVIFCGANDVDNALHIPRNLQSSLIEFGLFEPSSKAITDTNTAFTKLIDFIHLWATSATIDILNILPRESAARNLVTNSFNSHIKHISEVKQNVKMVSTERYRGLFSFRNGCRKSVYFSGNGLDNVHLNDTGNVRLAKFLKFYIHNRNMFS